MIKFENGIEEVYNEVNKEDNYYKTNQHHNLVYNGAIFYQGKKLKPQEVKSLYANSPDALKEYKKSRSLYGFSMFSAVVCSCFLIPVKVHFFAIIPKL